MIAVGALIAIHCALAAGFDTNTTLQERNQNYTQILNRNNSLYAELIKLNNTALNVNKVNEKRDTEGDEVLRSESLKDLKDKNYNIYEDRKDTDASNIFPIDESPDYASSIVLASDLLAITHAVGNIEERVCREQGYKFLEGLISRTRWAVQMFDASAKSPQGLLYGSTYHLGNFDECIYIKDATRDGLSVRGQYCLATIDWPKEKKANKERGTRAGPIRWAVCVPSTCNATTVQKFVKDIVENNVGNNISVSVTERDCSTRSPKTIIKLDIGFLSFLLIFVVIILISSLYESYTLMWGRKKTSHTHNLIISFSLLSNVKKVLSTKQNTSLGLECVVGIKALAMFFILFGHACIFTIGGPSMNLEATLQLSRSYVYGFIFNNVILVDTFLMLSAFLFCRLLLLEMDKRKGRLNILPILIFRYIRVTPAYLVVILFYMTWFPKIGQGPLWKERVELEQDRCLNSWWTNILYINNYVDTDKLCMFQSWYLSVDTQLFFIAPFFIYSLWHWRKVGPILLGIGIAISLIVPSFITYWNRLDPTFLIYADETKDLTSNYYFRTAYIKTHMKMTPYFIGLLTGFLLHKIQSNNYEFTRLTKTICWVTTLFVGSITAFSVTVFYQNGYNRAEATAYISLHKLAWSLANSWLLIACATGNGGIFYKLFSWKFLIPISRLTYCAYLVDGIVELFFAGEVYHPVHITALNFGSVAFAHIVFTFLLAMVLCITFESPIHGIEKVLLKMFDHRVLSDNVKKEEPPIPSKINT